MKGQRGTLRCPYATSASLRSVTHHVTPHIACRNKPVNRFVDMGDVSERLACRSPAPLVQTRPLTPLLGVLSGERSGVGTPHPSFGYSVGWWNESPWAMDVPPPNASLPNDSQGFQLPGFLQHFSPTTRRNRRLLVVGKE